MRLVATILAPALAALVLACGPAPQAAPGGPAGEATGPKSGGTVRVHANLDPHDWDITYSGKDQAAQGRPLSQESLLAFKVGPDVGPEDVIIQPRLAERWEVSPDAKTFTFHLRKGVKFMDRAPVNGRELKSDDVRWSFEYESRTGEFTKLPRANLGWMLEGLDRVETPDPYTAVVHFSEPFAPFLNYVSHEFMPILPREVYEKDGHLKDNLAGTGPFILDDRASQSGTRWVWKKNPTYWDPGKPYLDEVHAIVLKDDATAQAAFRTKQLDLLDSLLAKVADEVKRAVPDAVSGERPQNPMHIYLNNSRPPFNDVRVRQAFSLALDRDEFIRVEAGGRGVWSLAGTTPTTFSQGEIKSMVRHDSAAARRLLAEAGHPNGLTLEVPYPTDRGQIYLTRIELLQAQLSRSGFNMTAKALPYNEYSNLRRRGEHNLQYASKDTVADVDSYLFATFHPSSGGNYDRVNDPKLTAMLEAQRREPDPGKRSELIRQAARYLATDCYCGIAVFAGSLTNFWHPHLKNYRPSSQRSGWEVEATWLDK